MGDLKIINLVKNFQGMDRPAVNNVNLDINSGELVAFLGPCAVRNVRPSPPRARSCATAGNSRGLPSGSRRSG